MVGGGLGGLVGDWVERWGIEWEGGRRIGWDGGGGIGWMVGEG